MKKKEIEMKEFIKKKLNLTEDEFMNTPAERIFQMLMAKSELHQN